MPVDHPAHTLRQPTKELADADAWPALTPTLFPYVLVRETPNSPYQVGPHIAVCQWCSGLPPTLLSYAPVSAAVCLQRALRTPARPVSAHIGGCCSLVSTWAHGCCGMAKSTSLNPHTCLPVNGLVQKNSLIGLSPDLPLLCVGTYSDLSRPNPRPHSQSMSVVPWTWKLFRTIASLAT